MCRKPKLKPRHYRPMTILRNAPADAVEGGDLLIKIERNGDA